MAVRKTYLRCHNCGTRGEFDLSDMEERNLREWQTLTRACPTCIADTSWEPYDAPGGGRKADPHSGSTRGRVLLIDDDEDIRYILGKALTREHFEFDAAPSARDALTRLARTDYDVILSDIRMRDFDGKQLFQFLEEHLPECKDRVVFLTGDVGNPDTMSFLENVRRPYFAKPVDLPGLMTVLRGYIDPTPAYAPPPAVRYPMPAGGGGAAGTAPATAEMPDADAIATQIRSALVSKEQAIVTLQQQVRAVEEASKTAMTALQREADSMRELLLRREAELEAMRVEMTTKDEAARNKLSEARREHEAARGEVLRSERAAREAEDLLKEARQELTKAQTEAERTETHSRLEQSHRELEILKKLLAVRDEEIDTLCEQLTKLEEAKTGTKAALAARREGAPAVTEPASVPVAAPVEEPAAGSMAEGSPGADAGKLRHELVVQRRRVAELEEGAARLAELERERSGMKRDLKRKNTQLESLEEELGRAQSLAADLQKALQDFVRAVTDPVTVALASADITSFSKRLTAADAENVSEIRHNLDRVRKSLEKLAARAAAQAREE